MTTSATRYDAIVATFVGVLALAVSGYTAYIQRQQVRAQVWPMLEVGDTNVPFRRLQVSNKGVGPAIIRDVKVTFDGVPVKTWREALQKMLGPGGHVHQQGSMSHHVFSAGESLDVLVPMDANGAPLVPKLLDQKSKDAEGIVFDASLHRVGMEICYCSTLDDCWIRRDPANGPSSTSETRHCPPHSESSFDE